MTKYNGSAYERHIARVGKFDPDRPAVESNGIRYTEGELRELMADPRYWNPVQRDEAFRAGVDRLFKVAYG
jgi:hypothetical protein